MQSTNQKTIKMNFQKVTSLQKELGVYETQQAINDGSIWKIAGSEGRAAMGYLESGVCMLPKYSHTDYYGNKIPSRDELEKGSKGTFQNSVEFYSQYL